MKYNPELLLRQLTVKESGDILAGAYALREDVIGVDIIGENPVFLGMDVKLWPGTVLSTEDGPIWIGAGTEIEPHCFLKGPLYFGEQNRVKAGSRLYGGSSFGPHCRVAGEISQSVFQGYVNKQHEGFIGNSVLGQWVNLGAETTCSNLRNDYGSIPMKVGGKLVDSGERFIGLIAGDHTKTGIHTMFNTGTVVGIGANVYGDDFPPRHIPSFAWGGARGFRYVPFDRTMQAAQIAALRRGQKISDNEALLMHKLYKKMTKQETSD
jgi:UDP-N-acetylglucosamine diphosphorylase/glucosamine-1-phosphate N-acetyltransferase